MHAERAAEQATLGLSVPPETTHARGPSPVMRAIIATLLGLVVGGVVALATPRRHPAS